MKKCLSHDRTYNLADFFILLVLVICVLIAIFFPEAADSIKWWFTVGLCVLALYLADRIKRAPEGILGITFLHVIPLSIIGLLLLKVAYDHAPRVVFYLLVGVETAIVLAACIRRSREAINDFLDYISDLFRLVSFVCQVGLVFFFIIMMLLRFVLPDEKRKEYQWWIYGISLLLAVVLIIYLVSKQKTRRLKPKGVVSNKQSDNILE